MKYEFLFSSDTKINLTRTYLILANKRLCSRYYTAEAVTTDEHKASCGLSATAELLVEMDNNIRVKIGGGLWGLDPQWKTDNPRCKRQGKKLGGRVLTPPLGSWA